MVQAARRKVPVKRYFLSLITDRREQLAYMDDAPSPEAQDLFFQDIWAQLNKHVKLGSGHVPKAERNGHDALEKYVIEVTPQNGQEWRRLGDVIHDTYHNAGNCFIRELSKTQFIEILWDRERKLPIDYFAIKKNEESIFCLQTRYHKNLDAADIEVFYEGMKSEKWTQVKANLNHIFCSDDRADGIVPIGGYGRRLSEDEGMAKAWKAFSSNRLDSASN